MRDTRAALERVITYAQARNLVGRNVAALIKSPPGKASGRPSKALTVARAVAVLKAAEEDRLAAYVILSLQVGVRMEEARALQWDHVDLEGNPLDADPPVPPHGPSGGPYGRTGMSRQSSPAALWRCHSGP